MTVSGSDWVKGITLSIIASIIGGFSKLSIRKSWLIEHKYSSNKEESKEREVELASPRNEKKYDPPCYKNEVCLEPESEEVLTNENLKKLQRSKVLRWCGMIGMTILNPLFCVWAMKYASPSILAPFSGLTLVWIILLSPTVVDEKPDKAQVLAASLIIAGEVVVTISGDHTNEYYSADQVLASYSDPNFVLYFLLLLTWMVLLSWLILYGNDSSRRFAWGVAGGSITGLQNFLKDSLVLLQSSQTIHFVFMGSGAALSALIGLLLLVRCMKVYDATYSSSMFVGSFVLSASLMSSVHYHTFQNLQHTWNYICYPLGLVILLGGIFILSQDTSVRSLFRYGNIH